MLIFVVLFIFEIVSSHILSSMHNALLAVFSDVSVGVLIFTCINFILNVLMWCSRPKMNFM